MRNRSYANPDASSLSFKPQHGVRPKESWLGLVEGSSPLLLVSNIFLPIFWHFLWFCGPVEPTRGCINFRSSHMGGWRNGSALVFGSRTSPKVEGSSPLLLVSNHFFLAVLGVSNSSVVLSSPHM
ncbi:Hypothetical protein R9X50_00622800 [Acrodontium crateriforme]|uniref:Uncharacterized protein n=1 Tax=Acrodontium crateriforme TaxID=150365 RepID=A0AAQ3M7Y3_9PEZI|nr:Hypothetical protein R9X50_00622800 [Acrodontium crateriforme]